MGMSSNSVKSRTLMKYRAPVIKNRGAYLVQGPGHCGACHTPRGLAYQELALNLKDGDDYLSGAVIDG
jgi:mono/diheme cytochrome c family protein